jgi:hypothetical protein
MTVFSFGADAPEGAVATLCAGTTQANKRDRSGTAAGPSAEMDECDGDIEVNRLRFSLNGLRETRGGRIHRNAVQARTS